LRKGCPRDRKSAPLTKPRQDSSEADHILRTYIAFSRCECTQIENEISVLHLDPDSLKQAWDSTADIAIRKVFALDPDTNATPIFTDNVTACQQIVIATEQTNNGDSRSSTPA
jgi:hypothetical protein